MRASQGLRHRYTMPARRPQSSEDVAADYPDQCGHVDSAGRAHPVAATAGVAHAAPWGGLIGSVWTLVSGPVQRRRCFGVLHVTKMLGRC